MPSGWVSFPLVRSATHSFVGDVGQLGDRVMRMDAVDTRRARRGRRSHLASVLSIVIAAATLVGIAPASTAGAAVAAEFDPGFLISDANFYDSSAMTQFEIQSFLENRVSGPCTNSNCLYLKRIDSATVAANPMCDQYEGANSELASQVIFKVQKACGISAKVLLVTLEKEQGLISKRSPTDTELRKATGVQCPDTAPCSSEWAGLFNQLYGAMYWLKRYGMPTGTGPGTPYSTSYNWFPVGRSTGIQYHPDSARCGSSPVVIRNMATAVLYYYTPYQPNSAALTNLYGHGDTCSSYGNRNFWRLYSDWFGSPTGITLSPVGNLEVATASVDKATFRGWTFDPESAAPIDVHVYINDQWGGAFTASRSRHDVALAYPSYGPNHGFEISVPLHPDATTFTACLYAINIGFGENRLLGCRNLETPTGPPIGNLESAQLIGHRVDLVGWAIDPDTPAPIELRVVANGTDKGSLQADIARNDLASAYPGYGAAHGFSGSIDVTVGTTDVCVVGVNVGGGTDSTISCRTVSTASGPPIGNIDLAAIEGPGRAKISGWLLDPDTPESIDVHLYVNGRWGTALSADQLRRDIAAAYPGYGEAHGFTAELSVPGGRSEVCAYGINVRSGYNALISCRNVDAPSGSPYGNFEAAQPVDGGALLTGWAIDPDLSSAIEVHVYVNDHWGGSYRADVARPDVAVSYPAYGAAHGFSIQLKLDPGPARVCVYPINVGAGSNPLLGCRTLIR